MRKKVFNSNKKSYCKVNESRYNHKSQKSLFEDDEVEEMEDDVEDVEDDDAEDVEDDVETPAETSTATSDVQFGPVDKDDPNLESLTSSLADKIAEAIKSKEYAGQAGVHDVKLYNTLRDIYMKLTFGEYFGIVPETVVEEGYDYDDDDILYDDYEFDDLNTF